MTTTSSDTNLSQLVINELTQEEYEALTPEPNQLYLTPDESLTEGDLKTINGNSIVGSGDIGVGTVTSVNNVSPVNGNVTLSIPSIDNLANKDLSNLSSTGNAKFQAPLVSGTNIKTINSTSILGNGNVAVQPTLVSGTNIKTINGTSLLGSGNVAVQPTLVSGTNIKTINGTSLLGSGNLEVDSLPSQTSQSGKFLTTNGTSASWATITMPTVDQTYDATSANAQSGVAVAGAGFLTSITGSMVTTALGYTPYNSTNPNNYTSVVESTVSGWGFTKNTGTVTSVNNVSPVNGNVTLNIPSTDNLANKDLSNLSSIGNAKFQAPLVSGTNIKTINSTSLLGSGNISVGTVTSVNNVSPVNGNVTISIPDVEAYTVAEVQTLWSSI